jgi:hypothetical protein
MTETLSLAISAFAALVAIGSFAVAYSTELRTRMPVLVFIYMKDHVWELRNVGAAPAHNIVVAQSVGSMRIGQGVNEDWHNPVLLPAIPANGFTRLEWLTAESEAGLAASYTDAHRRFYTTKCGSDVSIVYFGLHIPRWPMVDQSCGKRVVRRLWQIRPGDAKESWSRVPQNKAVRPWWLLSGPGDPRRPHPATVVEAAQPPPGHPGHHPALAPPSRAQEVDLQGGPTPTDPAARRSTTSLLRSW